MTCVGYLRLFARATPFLLWAVCPLWSQSNLLINGDFSQGNIGFRSDYTYSATDCSPAGYYSVGNNPYSCNSAAPSFGDHTTGNGLMMIVNGAVTPGLVAWEETVPVLPGKNYVFGGWVADWGNDSGPQEPARLMVIINGATLSTLVPDTRDGNWTPFSIQWDSQSFTSAKIQIIDADLAAYQNDFALDDLNFAISSAQGNPTFSVYPVPGYSGDVASITTGSDQALWFTANNSIWRMTTAGTMTEYPLPDDGVFYSGGRGVWNITPGPDGALWFTELFAHKVGRITTAGVITEYVLPNSESAPEKIVAGSDGALWFTEFINENGRIGRITVDGAISEYPLSPCAGTCGRYPNGITAGPDGALWFTDLGDGRIHSITTSGIITDYGSVAGGVNGYAAGPITPGPDGALWFTLSGGNDALGRITTAGVITFFPLPLYPRATYNGYHNIEPDSITTGTDGALWFTSGEVTVLGRMTVQGKVDFYALPPIGIPFEYVRFSSITVGPDGALWIGDRGSVLRASIQVDKTPPSIITRAAPGIIWPPNGEMVPITISGRITDTESGVNSGTPAYKVTDDYGVVQPRGHITLDPSGKYSFVVRLQAWRKGADKDGRHYSIEVAAQDNAGNRGLTSVLVTVPHDHR